MARAYGAKRSGRIGGFLKGLLAGLLLAVAGLAALVFLTPEPELPGALVEAEGTEADLGTVQVAGPDPEPEPEVTAAPAREPVAISPVDLPELDLEPLPDDTRVVEEEPDSALETALGADGDTVPAEDTEPAAGDEMTPAEEGEPSLADEDEPSLADEEGQTLADEESAPSLPPALEDPRPVSLSGPALEVNAAAFEAEADAPLVGVVIGNVASGDVTPDVLFSLPFPATVGIVPGEEGDEAFASAARARNWEVVAELPVVEPDSDRPGALSPGMEDDEVAARTEALMGRLSQAIGVLDDGGTSLGDGAEVYGPVVSTLDQHGFAFIGTGAAGEAAETAGVAYARADRALGADASEDEVYAALDAAAAEAEANGAAVIVLPPTRAALQALARWNAEKGNESLAPLSAVIRKNTGG